MSDFVFDSNMKPVFNFEGMYQAEEIPWEQDGFGRRLSAYYKDSRKRLADLIKDLEGNLTEVGCGLGFSTDYLRKATGKSVVGLDISPTAVATATRNYPAIEFRVSDVRKDGVVGDIVVINECLWYIMDVMDDVVRNIQSKYIVVSQGFLPVQRYGTQYIDGFRGLVDYFLKYEGIIIRADYLFNQEPLRHGVLVVLNRGYE